jgi:competence protein ComEC
VDGCLRDLGIRVVPLLVITHLHADHVGGVAGVFHGRRVGMVLTSPLAEPEAGHAVLVAQTLARRVPVVVPAPGWTGAFGAVSLRLLAPVDVLHGTRSDPNNNSLVLRADVGGVRIMLSGDAEVEEQAALRVATAPALLRVDVLKVAHHGSAYQDPGLLEAAGAAVGLVSVGAGNDYGHPSEAVLARLSRAGTRVLRTDRDGTVAVVWTGRGLAVVRRGHAP